MKNAVTSTISPARTPSPVVPDLDAFIASLPPVLGLQELKVNFQIGRTTAYHLASNGEVESLTLGAPGKRGKRVFLTKSVLEYVQRRLADSQPLNCKPKQPARDAQSSREKWLERA
jgi:hypothetical protein